jgi:flagellar basal-body rod modification protein FlgD
MTQTGVVTKTKLNGDSEPTLVVGNTDVQLSKVTEVQQNATGPATTTGQTATTPPTAPAATTPPATTTPASTSDDSATTKDN